MKFEITQDVLVEIVQCIVHNELKEDEAIDYELAVLEESSDIEDAKYSKVADAR
jgi:hypothetical protein